MPVPALPNDRGGAGMAPGRLASRPRVPSRGRQMYHSTKFPAGSPQLLPSLVVWPYFYRERPSRTILMGNVVDLFGDGGGFTKEFVRLAWKYTVPRPRCIDGRIYRYVSDVNAFGSEVACHGFRQNSLRRLCRRKHSCRRFAAPRCCVACHDQHPFTRRDHSGKNGLSEHHQRCDINAEHLLECHRISFC